MYFKKLFLEIWQYSQETPVLESLFKKIADLRACNFMKKRPQPWRFPVNVSNFFRLPISKNIFERLIFDCFNGSLLHSPKISRSRLYENVRLQGPGHRSSFLFLSRHLNQVPTCTKRSTFDESIKCLYWLSLVVLDSFRLF